MAVHDALHCGQADPGPFELVRGVQALKRRKEFIGIGHVKTSTVVTHIIYYFAIVLCPPHLDPRVWQPGGKLPRIVQHILQHHLQQAPVAIDKQSVGDAALNVSVGVCLLQLCRCHPGERAQIHGFRADVRARQARQVQQRINESREMLGETVKVR